jgi:tRNA pseudouridine32 synthase/23S rRNA pseudouridine746 synthase/23S rRNA pseudouridine1911/1915/1917 synthase
VALLADRTGAACLWDALPDRLGTRPYLVHRLDKGTSGVLLVALDRPTQRRLTRAFQARDVRKYYLAWTMGAPPDGRTRTIDLPLRKGRKSRYRVAGPRDSIRQGPSGWTLGSRDGDGHASLTRLRVLRRHGERTLVLAAPVTGRTHQIRVHLAWIGYPLLGDHLYGRPGDPAQQAPRLQLHCHRLVVPGYGTFSAETPVDWMPA